MQLLTIPCGTLVPNLSVTCSAGGQRSSSEDTTSRELSAGASQNVGKSIDCPFETIGPGGRIDGKLAATCVQDTATAEAARTTLTFNASAERRCGLGRDGSDVGVRSVWEAKVELPDSTANYDVTISVLEARRDLSQGDCTLTMSDQSGPPVKAGSTKTVSVRGGQHTLRLDCSGAPGQRGLLILGCYGAPRNPEPGRNVSPPTVDENLKLQLSARLR